MCKTHSKRPLILTFIFVVFGNLFSQITGELQLANEYYKSGEYKKAKILYEELLKDKSKVDFIYDNYLSTLEKLNEYVAAEKFIKKNVKKFEDNPKYKIDHYLIFKKQNKNEEANKLKEKYAEQISINRNQIFDAYAILADRGEYGFIIALLSKARKNMKEPTLFAEQLASSYKAIGNRVMMITEMINMVKYESNDQELLKNKLQPLLDNEQDLDILQKLLIETIQKNPEDDSATLLLVWVLIQRREFSMALVQAKAYDRRKKVGGEQIYQLAKIAFENKDYETVIEASGYIKTAYPSTDTYFAISMLSLRSKEEILKQKYPVDRVKVSELVADYADVCKKNAATPYCAEALRKEALLLAFYLNKQDTAIKMLESIIKSFANDRNVVDRTKLDLGDLYILKDDHWESVLLYTQVEKTQKENLLGHEAKFKNAKVHYYKGDFDLAEEQLDVLKLATSREIANDALYLSLIIHMNKSEDSVQNALNVFAKADLEKFSQNLDAAEISYKKLIEEYPNDALVDDALWNLAEISIRKQLYDQAILQLDQLLQKYHADIFADDALFTKAELYETKLRDPSKAMEFYQKLMTDYPSSIYTTEARKRFRKLRGDKL
jgi:tetratricopeptide (TPR) repeat protein